MRPTTLITISITSSILIIWLLYTTARTLRDYWPSLDMQDKLLGIGILGSAPLAFIVAMLLIWLR